jgi:hypothetical protein
MSHLPCNACATDLLLVGLDGQLRHVHGSTGRYNASPKPLTGVEQLELDLQQQAAGWRYEAFATNHDLPQPPRNPRNRSPPGSTAATGSTPESKPTSKTATPPARNACPPRSSPSTPPGTAPRPSPPTSSPGCNYSPATATSPAPNPAPCNTRYSTPPATLTRGGRRRWLNFPPNWPFTTHIQTIFQRLLALPIPT